MKKHQSEETAGMMRRQEELREKMRKEMEEKMRQEREEFEREKALLEQRLKIELAATQEQLGDRYGSNRPQSVAIVSLLI